MNKFKRNSEMEVSRGNKKAKIWIFKVIWICQKKIFYILRILVTFYDNIPSFQKKECLQRWSLFCTPKIDTPQPKSCYWTGFLISYFLSPFTGYSPAQLVMTIKYRKAAGAVFSKIIHSICHVLKWLCFDMTASHALIF